MQNPIIIFGASGLGRTALEIFNENQAIVYGFLDEDKTLHGGEIDKISVLGNPDDQGFLKLIGKKCDAFIAADEIAYRRSLVQVLLEKRKVMPTNAVHRRAYVSSSAHIGHGNMIDAHVNIGAGSEIKNHILIRANAQLGYEVMVEEYVNIGSGAIIGDKVSIGEGCFIGAGARIVDGVKIGKNARIGMGSVVIANVKEGSTVFGNPAKEV